MNLKDLHVGRWYRCRDERMLGHVVGRVLGENTYPFAVVLYRDGKYHDVVSMTVGGRITDPDEHSFDLVEFLQGCNGPDWKPQKWRPVSVEDLRDGMKRARFRNFSAAAWIESHLRGARWKGNTLEWHDLIEDRFWIYCEVLDD